MSDTFGQLFGNVKQESPQITEAQRTALIAAAEHFGSQWKGKLKDCWMKASYPDSLSAYSADLQSFRNQHGATGLNKFRLPR